MGAFAALAKLLFGYRESFAAMNTINVHVLLEPAGVRQTRKEIDGSIVDQRPGKSTEMRE